jgi:hypothetical protein
MIEMRREELPLVEEVSDLTTDQLRAWLQHCPPDQHPLLSECLAQELQEREEQDLIGFFL